MQLYAICNRTNRHSCSNLKHYQLRDILQTQGSEQRHIVCRGQEVELPVAISGSLPSTEAIHQTLSL